MQPRPFVSIVAGGLTAGVLDIADALIFFGLRGVPARSILQSIASGLLGASAFQGGMATAALGLGLHFVIALGAATLYYVASRRLPFLWRHPWVWGAVFGLGVYVFMNYVVLPLSAFNVRPGPVNVPVLVNGLLAHVFLVGIPIALAARRSAGRRLQT